MIDGKKRSAVMPAQASDFVVTIGGREQRWLTVVLRAVLRPLLRWRVPRQAGRS